MLPLDTDLHYSIVFQCLVRGNKGNARFRLTLDFITTVYKVDKHAQNLMTLLASSTLKLFIL